jgi:mRNA interferase HigB
MHIITRKRLLEFAAKYPNARSELDHWYRVMKRNNFDTFAALRQTFPGADRVGKLTVFNIGGNKARLIAAIHYDRRRVYIRHVLTHSEYDKGNWKEE